MVQAGLHDALRIAVVLVVAGLVSGCDAGSRTTGRADAKSPTTAAKATPAPLQISEPEGPHNPEIVAALAEADPFVRIERLAKLLPSLGPEALPEVRTSLKDLQDKLAVPGVGAYALLLHFWSKHDPEGAARFALHDAPFAYRDAVVISAVYEWARLDPQAAAGAVEAVARRPGARTDLPDIGLVRGWFDSGKPGLADYVQQLNIGFRRQRDLEVLIRMWIQRDGPEPVERWLKQVPDKDSAFKKAAYRQFGRSFAMSDPPAAASWCDQHCGEPFTNGIRGLISVQLAVRDGPATMQWLSRAPPGKERDAAVQSAVSGWWRTDRKSFMKWADQLARDGIPPYFQSGLELTAAAIAREPGQAAHGVEWAMRIQDEKTRKRALINVARIWRRADQKAADAWLKSSPLSEEERDKVVHPVAGRVFGRKKG